MNKQFITILLALWGLLMLPTVSKSEDTSLTKKQQVWLKSTLNAYRKGTYKLLPFPAAQTEQTQNTELSQMYQKYPPGQIEATAIAYHGAMKQPKETIWIDRMALANRIASNSKVPVALTQETDALEYLPNALKQVYLKTKSRKAIEVLILLHLDGHYQTILDGTRSSLFFQFPQDFGKAMQQVSKFNPRAFQVFLEDFAYNLSLEPKLLNNTITLRDKCKASRSQKDAFLQTFLTTLINQAQARSH